MFKGFEGFKGVALPSVYTKGPDKGPNIAKEEENKKVVVLNYEPIYKENK